METDNPSTAGTTEIVAPAEEQARLILDHAAHLLPAQGPIGVFIHHNTLHAFEDLPFEEAVVRAGARFDCRPFLEEERYREALTSGRIRLDDLRTTLREEYGARGDEILPAGLTRIDLRMAMLQHALHEPDAAELDWFLNESILGLDQTLWNSCREVVEPMGAQPLPPPRMTRLRDLLMAATGDDSDALLHPLLIRLCAAFTDQGLAYWPMPERERGLFFVFVDLYRRGPVPDAWLAGLHARLGGMEERKTSPARSIVDSLGRMGIRREEWGDFLEETLLALRGWPGMIHHIEERPDRAHHPVPPGSLIDYMAVRLILEEFAVAEVARRSLDYDGPLSGVRQAVASRLPPPSSRSVDQRAYLLYQVARRIGRSAPSGMLLEEIEAFSSIERRKIFHLAYERRYRQQTLDALARHAGGKPDFGRCPFQTIHCIDEREESFRRHLEETEPSCETFGTAGFFGVAMYYRGAADAHPASLCPIAIRPEHLVKEEVAGQFEDSRRRRGVVRRMLGRTAYAAHVGSRTGVRGSILTGIFGMLASIPLILRVFFPRHAARLRSGAGALFRPPSATRLRLEAAGLLVEGVRRGYTVEEMTGIVRRVLEEIGLTRRFARLVLVVGHGSSSLNNPHESAHDCGACGGGRGGPNARAFAMMANDPRVRERLLSLAGWTVPSETTFVGCWHNTCNDAMRYDDLDLLPESRVDDLQRAQDALDRARALNAHERCRRFDGAPLDLTPEAALIHVEERAEDLSQVRPEYGHATNATAVVGRRDRTRGLSMDRRAFLVSYDPSADADGAILVRILQAVVPVCAGINLEYYFSFVDPAGYGSGTKLPHNITSLLGVMDGHAGDLRTGLPWQMVDIHEPVRLLIVVEARADRVLDALHRLPQIHNLVRNRWIHVAALDPDSNAIFYWRDGAFEPHLPEEGELPVARSSGEWYGGRREHLGYARVTT